MRSLAVPASVSARRLLVDRAWVPIAVLFYVLVVAALSGLWRGAAAHGPIAGYTAVALTWYIVAAEAAVTALNARMIEEIGDDIASGAVAVELLRPVAIVAVRLATAVAGCLTRLGALAATGVVLGYVLVGPPPSWGALALAAPSLVLAVACNVALQHTVAAVSFWIRDSRSAWFLYQKLVFLLGGMLLPLQVLPQPLYAVAIRSPFAAMAYAPARLAAGHVEPALLAMQAGWLGVLVAVSAAAFGLGERRLQVVGG